MFRKCRQNRLYRTPAESTAGKVRRCFQAPVGKQANFLAVFHDSIVAFLTGITATRRVHVSFQRNLLAVDVWPTADPAQLLGVQQICSLDVKSKPLTDNTCVGPVYRGLAFLGVTGELVLCITSCHGASRDVALVLRGRAGSTDAKEVQAASYALPWPRSYPKEHRGWPQEPFNGPFVALVSTRPENKERRELIRKNWAKPSLYPKGAFRLIFFVREPGPREKIMYLFRGSLLRESDKYADMLIDGYALSTLRAAILEWAPAFANAPRLLLWARDDTAFDPSTLLTRMESLANTPGDVFGRVAGPDNNDTVFSENTTIADLSWEQLEQCAYFIKMAALLRLSSVYEDVTRKVGESEEFELVSPSLATRANLTLVAIDDPSPCAPSGGKDRPTTRTMSKSQ
ncbi:hypothetical protein MRX96_046765 [Rhipicephalus microplus]